MRNKNIIWGIILILVGLTAGLSAMEILPEPYILFILSLGFLAVYFFYKKLLGLLIPGTILFMVAIFTTAEEYYTRLNDSVITAMLGIAFLLIFFIHTMHIRTNKTGDKYWPLFPGIALIAAGIILALTENKILLSDQIYLELIIPAIILIIGIIIFFLGVFPKKSDNKTDPLEKPE